MAMSRQSLLELYGLMMANTRIIMEMIEHIPLTKITQGEKTSRWGNKKVTLKGHTTPIVFTVLYHVQDNGRWRQEEGPVLGIPYRLNKSTVVVKLLAGKDAYPVHTYHDVKDDVNIKFSLIKAWKVCPQNELPLYAGLDIQTKLFVEALKNLRV